MTRIATAVFILTVFSVSFGQVKRPEQPAVKAPFSSSTQALLVISDDWNAVKARARLFERKTATSRWERSGEEFPVVLGRSGLAWSADAAQGNAAVLKKEGDGRSPAGIFPLTYAFGSASKPEALGFPYVKLGETTECVDDAASIHYNKIVDRMKVGVFDWKSSEKMLAVGEEYALGIFVAYNTYPVTRGSGSCIFLHIWKDGETPTSGCTAMERRRLEALLAKLDPARTPYLIQLPESEYKRLRKEWDLPR